MVINKFSNDNSFFQPAKGPYVDVCLKPIVVGGAAIAVKLSFCDSLTRAIRKIDE